MTEDKHLGITFVVTLIKCVRIGPHMLTTKYKKHHFIDMIKDIERNPNLILATALLFFYNFFAMQEVD